MKSHTLIILFLMLTFSAMHVMGVPCLVERHETASVCPGGSYNFYGRIVTIPYRYFDTIPGNNGSCDTAITLNLELWSPIFPPVYSAICAGYSYNFNGRILTAAGTYYDTLTSVGGCDSVQSLILQVAPYARINLFDSMC